MNGAKIRPALLSALSWFSLLVVLGITVMAMLAGQRIDGVATMMGLLTLFIGAVVAAFSQRYMRTDQRLNVYFVSISLLVASVLATVLSANLAVLAAAWCMSSLLMVGLIGHRTDWAEARAASRRALSSFIIGDAALVAALALLASHSASFKIEDALRAAETMSSEMSIAVTLLLLVAAAARCALPPFSGWLLSSMTAPTPVSALMHAGFVNAGGFLLIRFSPLFEAAPSVRLLAVAIGVIAALYGIGVMSVRPDIKRSLAGSTVSQMGFMIMSCGMGAYAAALWHIVAHGLFKAWLFLGSGSAIGVDVRSERFQRQKANVGAVAGVTLLAGVVLALAGRTSADMVPLLLAAATAATTLFANVNERLPFRARLSLIGLLAVLIAFHGVGLAIAHWAVDAGAQPLIAPWQLVLLLTVLLSAWVWQDRHLSEGRSLHPAIYVKLLNAGALKSAPLGESK